MNHYQHQNPLGGSHQDHMMHGHHNHHSDSGSCHSSPPSTAHDHSHHHGHGGHGGGDMCSMNMLLNWSTTDLCIFSHHFRIPADDWVLWAAGLGFVFLFCAGYEMMKSQVKAYDVQVSRDIDAIVAKKIDAGTNRENGSCSSNATGGEETRVTKAGLRFARSKKLTRGMLYALQYFYGMMAMLLFMTYNVQVMAACTLGALVGFVRFADDVPGAGGEEGKGACH